MILSFAYLAVAGESVWNVNQQSVLAPTATDIDIGHTNMSLQLVDMLFTRVCAQKCGANQSAPEEIDCSCFT